MAAEILDGRKLADDLIDEIRRRILARQRAGLRAPGLAVIQVGEDPASQVYVRNKRKACAKAGLVTRDFDLPADFGQAALLELIDQLNVDPRIDGVLVQLPLPPQIDTTAVIDRIHADKDVDGFHVESIGRLALRKPGLRPCTPKGVMTLLAHTHKPVLGKDALVVGAEPALELCAERSLEGDAGELFGALCVFFRQGRQDLFEAALARFASKLGSFPASMSSTL